MNSRCQIRLAAYSFVNHRQLCAQLVEHVIRASGSELLSLLRELTWLWAHSLLCEDTLYLSQVLLLLLLLLIEELVLGKEILLLLRCLTDEVGHGVGTSDHSLLLLLLTLHHLQPTNQLLLSEIIGVLLL